MRDRHTCFERGRRTCHWAGGRRGVWRTDFVLFRGKFVQFEIGTDGNQELQPTRVIVAPWALSL